jgi:hypothetical protein
MRSSKSSITTASTATIIDLQPFTDSTILLHLLARPVRIIEENINGGTQEATRMATASAACGL